MFLSLQRLHGWKHWQLLDVFFLVHESCLNRGQWLPSKHDQNIPPKDGATNNEAVSCQVSVDVNQTMSIETVHRLTEGLPNWNSIIDIFQQTVHQNLLHTWLNRTGEAEARRQRIKIMDCICCSKLIQFPFMKVNHLPPSPSDIYILSSRMHFCNLTTTALYDEKLNQKAWATTQECFCG